MYLFFLFFFKQKTAYEMRISDWSSDVCSSDLRAPHRKGAETEPEDKRKATGPHPGQRHAPRAGPEEEPCADRPVQPHQRGIRPPAARQRADQPAPQIGRASRKERACPYV